MIDFLARIKKGGIMKYIKLIISILLIGVLLAGCGGSSKFEPIDSSEDAEQLVEWVSRRIENIVTNSLDGGTFENVVVKGAEGGKATINGYINYETGDCGSDCVSSTYEADLTIEFSKFADDKFVEITSGIVNFSEYRHTTQSGLNYNSNTNIKLDSDGLVKASVITWSYEGEDHGIEDIVEFHSSGSSFSKLRGTCTTKSGDTYSY